jgi:Na+/proline symporter
LLTTRVSIIVFSAVATVLACLQSNIYELVGGSSIFSLVSLFIPLTFGLYWKKANSYGAIASMFLGLITWLVFLYVPIPIPSLVPAVGASLLGMIIGSILKKEIA